jgi:exo-1,4-beta-D-glucosaminidase
MNFITRAIVRIRPGIPVLLLLLPGHLLWGTQAAAGPTSQDSVSQKLLLRDHWAVQSSAKVQTKGEIISTSAYVPNGWHDATLPTTVVAALVHDKTLPDPFFAMNLRQFPGVTYPIGANFSNLAMPRDSPYAVSWWYRKQFNAPSLYAGKTVWLNFRGINYRANIWLNGKQIANSRDVAGAWRTYEFNVTDAVKAGDENILAVQVVAPTQKDLAVTFVDWNPAPPDKNMGLWREVYLTASGPVALRYPTVISKLNSPANDSARLTVTAQLKNAASQPVRGKFKVSITDTIASRKWNSLQTKPKT